MNKQELQELMHGEIDGANPAADSRRLHEYLQKHAEDRRIYEELCEAVAALESVEMCEPSPELRRAILAAVQDIEATAPAHTGAGGGLLRRWGAVLKAQPGYGYAFAAGLALGVVAIAAFGPRLSGPGSPAQNDLFGTAIPAETSMFAASPTLAIDYPDVTGSVRVHFDAGRVAVRVELDTAGPVEVVLAAESGLTCDSFLALVPGSHDLTTTAGTARLTHTGRGAYEFTLRAGGDGTSPVTVIISADGAVLGERTFSPQ